MKHSDEGANWKKALIHLWIGFLLLLFFYLLSFGSQWKKSRIPPFQGDTSFSTQQSWTGEMTKHTGAFYLAKFTQSAKDSSF